MVFYIRKILIFTIFYRLKIFSKSIFFHMMRNHENIEFFLNYAVFDPNIALTSHPNDVALPHSVTHTPTGAPCPGRGLNPSLSRGWR